MKSCGAPRELKNSAVALSEEKDVYAYSILLLCTPDDAYRPLSFQLTRSLKGSDCLALYLILLCVRTLTRVTKE